MLRPSRPMMRPFMSSAWSCTTRDGGLGGVAGGQPLHHHGQDVADAALGVALGLLLDRAEPARRLVPHLILELLHEQRLRLEASSPDVARAGGPPVPGARRSGPPSRPAAARARRARLRALSTSRSRPFSAPRRGSPRRRRRHRHHARGRQLVAWPPATLGAGVRFAQQGGGDHQAHGHHAPRDHDFHCFSSPRRRPGGAARAQLPVCQRRQAEPCLGVGGGGQQEGDHHGRPRQMAALVRCWVGSAGAPARMRCLIVRWNGSRLPSSLKLLRPRRKCRFAGFHEPGGSTCRW